MSASSIGSSNSSSLWQLLRGLSSTTASSSTPATETAPRLRLVGGTSVTAPASDTAATTATSLPFSSELLTVLLGLQQAATSTPTSDTTATTDSSLDRLFSAIDSDSSGDISAEEFSAFVQSLGGSSAIATQIYAVLDSDGNGSVGLADLAAALPPPPPPHFTDIAQDMLSTIDSDGDGELADSELDDLADSLGVSSAETQAVLQTLDSNGDGALTVDELAQQLQAMFQTFLAQQSGPANTATTKTSAHLSIVA
jgi:Ca2+-binding EF-hand superfamily protein